MITWEQLIEALERAPQEEYQTTWYVEYEFAPALWAVVQLSKEDDTVMDFDIWSVHKFYYQGDALSFLERAKNCLALHLQQEVYYKEPMIHVPKHDTLLHLAQQHYYPIREILVYRQKDMEGSREALGFTHKTYPCMFTTVRTPEVVTVTNVQRHPEFPCDVIKIHFTTKSGEEGCARL